MIVYHGTRPTAEQLRGRIAGSYYYVADQEPSGRFIQMAVYGTVPNAALDPNGGGRVSLVSFPGLVCPLRSPSPLAVGGRPIFFVFFDFYLMDVKYDFSFALDILS